MVLLEVSFSPQMFIKHDGRLSAPFYLVGFLTALLLLLTLCVDASAFDLENRIKTFTLQNGLKVIFLKREGAPIFAARIAFKVGSVEERRGLTGTAHMLEHMMFKGTKTLGSLDWEKEKPLLEKVNQLGAKLDNAIREGEPEGSIKVLRTELATATAEQKKLVVSEIYSKLYSSEGGVGYNAGTSKDLTSYIIRLPVNKLELWVYIESDRLKNAVFREYYSERDVVMEERRRSYENRPDGKLYERFLSTAFIAHPYGEPIIGWESDIARLPLSEINRFWNSWYVPNNAVIAIVGDLDFITVKSMVTKYFANIPAGKLPDRIVTKEPEQDGERRVTVEFDANESMLIGFHQPVYPDRDAAVLSVIDGILSNGRTSRFEKELVRNKKVAVSIGTFSAPGSRYDNLFVISADPLPPHKSKDVEAGILEEIEKLKNKPVGAAEIAKVKTNIKAKLIRELASHYGMARLLAWYELVTGDYKNLFKEMKQVESVTAEDVSRVAKKYLTSSNMTVALLKRGEKK